MTQALAYKSASALLAGYKAKRFTPLEALDAVLARIAQCDPTLNAFRLVDVRRAKRAARASTERWARGEPSGRLDGVPVAIKDVTETKGWPTLNGSLAIDPKGPWREDAVVVERFRAHGAVLIGKTETPEYAWRGITESKLHGVTRNPWNPLWTPCGSSGGSAAAVAAGMVTIATGTDSGGSIRGPASFCSVVGLKPTFGRVPVWPVSPMLSMEHCGALTRTVTDAALALSVMAGFDPRDGYALHESAPDVLSGLNRGVRDLRIAYSPDLSIASIDPEVHRGISQTRRVFTELGARVTKVNLDLSDSLRISDDLCDAVAARVLVSLGRRRSKVTNPLFLASASRGAEQTALSYVNADLERSGLRAKMAEFHTRYDLLIAPSVTVPPFAADGDDADGWRVPTAGSRWMSTLLPFDLTGQPSISVPCGFSAAGGPFGLQIVGAYGADALVLQAARAFEKAQPVGRRQPPI
jgi:aspartyl-tRNA(Asn)/glutamyl-tRNA(Gln) amidotransferase subunit A